MGCIYTDYFSNLIGFQKPIRFEVELLYICITMSENTTANFEISPSINGHKANTLCVTSKMILQHSQEGNFYTSDTNQKYRNYNNDMEKILCL
jgi:hypothetical protein